MSTAVTTSARAEHTLKLRNAKPSFFGTVRGEFFKIGRQWTNWIMLVLLLGVIVLPYIIEMTAPIVILQGARRACVRTHFAIIEC